jgi:hypothetical protein
MEQKKHICPICEKDPTSHSLSKIKEENGKAIYYTSPAKAMSKQREGIIKHYDLVLGENTMPWIWIFDCKDYPLSHALDIKTAIELAKLINTKYSQNLEKLIIINSTSFISVIINILSIFVSKEFKEKIEISNNILNDNK